MQYTDGEHIISNPERLLPFLKAIVTPSTELYRPQVVKFKIRIVDSSIVLVDPKHKSWLRTVEVIKMCKKFKSVDLEAIKEISIGYIQGLISPFINIKGQFAGSNGTYYQVYFKLSYK